MKAALAGALAACAVLSACTAPVDTAPVGAASGTPTATATATASATSAGAVPTCRQAAARLPREAQVGQLLVAGVHGAFVGASRSAVLDHRVGSVILMGKADGGVAGVARLTASIRAAGAPTSAADPVATMVTVDQEGGQVVRLRGPGFDPMPSAAQQATLPDAQLRARARTWGAQLRAAGVHLNWAPVADVVPAAKRSSNAPIGRLGRGYGSDPAIVARKVTAVVRGFSDAGFGSAVKHYPGLGEVTSNTDFAATVVDRDTTRRDPAQAGFAAAVTAGVDSVMVATARYTRIDPENQAVFSPAVLGMVRDDLGFGGVIASDDLGVAEAVADVPARERALRFVRAGGDLAITVDPALVDELADGLLDAAASDPALARRVEESAGRVLTLKARRGLADCSPAGPGIR